MMGSSGNSRESAVNQRSSKLSKIIRGVTLLAVVVTVIALYRRYDDILSLENLAAKESDLRQMRVDYPYAVYAVAFAIYVAVTGLSLPGATVLSLVLGWYFHFLRAFVLVSFASTAGATVAFLLSRYLLRDMIQKRFADKLEAVNESLKREGAFYLFTLRLIPAIPFFVINVVMGLTPLRTHTFWWVSQLGMLPGTALYIYVGSQFPDLNTLAEKGTRGILTPQLMLGFALLGIFPLVAKRLLAKFQPASDTLKRAATGASKHRKLP